MKLTCSSLSIRPGLDLYHYGPSLDHGSLPSFLYLSLSGPDSLCTDPYNQPVQFLSDLQIRIFSLTLPAHENGLSPHNALTLWADDFQKGIDPLAPFLATAHEAIDFIFRQKLSERLAVGGLSRGALFASLLAARREEIRTIVGFAPLTRLSLCKEFHALQQHPLLVPYDLRQHAAPLASKQLRFYMGNRDVRVGTRTCFECIEAIVESAHEQHIRSPQIELIVGPSIGQMGHGTSLETFYGGADWIATQLGLFRD